MAKSTIFCSKQPDYKGVRRMSRGWEDGSHRCARRLWRTLVDGRRAERFEGPHARIGGSSRRREARPRDRARPPGASRPPCSVKKPPPPPALVGVPLAPEPFSARATGGAASG